MEAVYQEQTGDEKGGGSWAAVGHWWVEWLIGLIKLIKSTNQPNQLL
jgi:hypothetical protein